MEALIITLVVIIVLVMIGGFAYWYYLWMQDLSSARINELVDRINERNYYAYRFDRLQDTNIQNLDTNITNVFNNYEALRNDVQSISADYLRRNDLSKTINTDKAVLNTLQVNSYMLTSSPSLSNTAIPMGSATGEDWLYMYRGDSWDGGLALKKIKAEQGLFTDGTFDGKVVVGGNADLVFTGGNSWVLSTPEDGTDTLTIMSGRNGSNWDMAKKVVVDRNGYVNALGGGVTVRGGTSTHNIDNTFTQFPSMKDNKNYIAGDTIIRGDTQVAGNVCLGNICLKESAGELQACDKQLVACKKIVMA